MSSSMMRIDSEVINDIKFLKGIVGNGGSHQELIKALVKDELSKTHISTVDGYVGVGAVIKVPTGEVLVIENVTKDRISFTDGSCLINGGLISHNIRLLSEDIQNYAGGLIHG
jgi:hypothetical protein